MNSGKKESGFIDLALSVGVVCAAVIAVGLLIPSVRPLALELGTGLCFVVVAAGLGVLLYAGWRIVAYSSRNRRAAASARADISR